MSTKPMVRLFLLTEPIDYSAIDAQLPKLRKSICRLKFSIVGSVPLQRPNKLTKRQTEVLKLMVMGLETKEIAGKLSRSIKTIESHRTELMERMGTRSLPILVRHAIRTGIVPVSWLFE